MVNESFWRRQWHPTPVPLPGKSHGRRSLVGCSPWDHEESDTTEQLHFHFSLPCTGAENGNPLQCSCLENPRDGGAWWAAVYGVAQSWTRLKRLSSGSNESVHDQKEHTGLKFMTSIHYLLSNRFTRRFCEGGSSWLAYYSLVNWTVLSVWEILFVNIVP